MKVKLRPLPKAGAGPLALPVAQGAVPAEWRAAAAAAGFTGQAGQVARLPTPEGLVLLLGCGCPRRTLDWEQAGGLATADLQGASRITLDARGLAPPAAAALATGAALRAWRHDAHRRRAEGTLQRLDLVVDDPAAAEPAWARAEAALRGALLARELTAEPANILTPASFAARLEALAEHGISVDVLGPKRLRRLGMGGLLAVGSGAAEKHGPRLAVLRWRGSFAAPPVAFIGKGLCFDTGGISIKPAQGMEAMKADMAGAAACAGAMLALALRRSPAPAVAVLPIAENSTGAASYRPGDVLRMFSGTTVEVVDTDAEGRLVLADALHYAATRFKPAAMLDLATLTGSIITALGHHRAGIFGTDAALQAQAAAAGEAVGEPLWPMPIGARHREDLKSDIADLRQCCTGRALPDACHAAAFLREFAGGTPWAHLDIAGVDQFEEDAPLGAKGPSGFGARLLDRLVELYFEDPDRH